MVDEVRDIISETIHSLLVEDSEISPDQLADGIVKSLALEQEWAVAEYDKSGNLSHLRDHDYEFESVHRRFRLSEDVAGLGIVTRIFTHWKKV